MANYWKFNTSLLEIVDCQKWLETLIQQALAGAITWNKWWGSLKYRIRFSAIKYGRQLKLDRAKKAKTLDDWLSWAVGMGDSLAVDQAKLDLDHETSEHCNGFVVRNRLDCFQQSHEM